MVCRTADLYGWTMMVVQNFSDIRMNLFEVCFGYGVSSSFGREYQMYIEF